MIWLLWISVIVGLAATVSDIRSRTIPNALSGAAFASGLAARTALFGWAGAQDALVGGLIGFAVFLVFFLMGGMGGGDVKLMAGFGAILGHPQIITAAIMTAMAGGLMALAYLAYKKGRRMLKQEGPSADGPDRKDYIPYAPAIAVGVLLSFLSEEELWTSVC